MNEMSPCFTKDRSPHDQAHLVSEYICELIGTGPFLPYEDYDLIGEWLEIAHMDRVLLAVCEIYRQYFNKHQSYPKSIRLIHPMMMKTLKY